MKYTLIIAMLLLVSTVSFGQGTKNFIDQPYVEVTGKAEMEIVPDEIYLNITIDENDSKGKITVEQLEKEMIKKLKELNIDIEKQLKVKDIASNFQKYFLKKTEIQTSKEYQLLLHDGLTVAKVFIQLESVGISNIEIEKVDHSEIEKYRQEVKINAIKAAKEKAGQLAEAIGQTIGKAIYIQEIENVYMAKAFANTVMLRGVSSLKDEEELPNLEFEKIPLEYSVQVYFELK
jgi:uncharacterized protein